MLDEGGIVRQRAAGVFVARGRKDAHFFTQIANRNLYRAQQIRVIRHHDGAFIVILESVQQHLRRQVDIIAFLLGFD